MCINGKAKCIMSGLFDNASRKTDFTKSVLLLMLALTLVIFDNTAEEQPVVNISVMPYILPLSLLLIFITMRCSLLWWTKEHFILTTDKVQK